MYLGLGHTNYVKRSRQAHETISTIPMKTFYPILVTDVFAFVYMLIRFGIKGQKLTPQQAMTGKPCEHHISQCNYPSLQVTYAFGFVDLLISFWDQRSKVKVTADGHITVDGNPSSSI